MPSSFLVFDLLAVGTSAITYQIFSGNVHDVGLLIGLSVVFVLMSFILAYQLRATTTLFNAFTVLWALVDLVLGTAFDILYVVFDTIINRLIFGYTGRVLFASLILWAIGAAITESHDEIFEAIDEFYCEIRPIRATAADIAARLDPIWEIYSCFWNLFMSFGSTAFAVFANISVDCVDSTLWFEYLREIGVLVGAVLQTILSWITVVNSDNVGGPLYNNITIYDPNPTRVDVWKSWVAIVDLTTTFDDCLCEDPFLQDVLDFVYARATSDSLGCAIHELVNSALNFVQATLQIIIETPTRPPNYRLPFQRLCAALVCLGDWFDELIVAIQDVFVFDVFGEVPIDFRIGCIVSRFLCIWVELASSLTTFTVELLFDCIDNFGTCTLLDVVSDLDLVPVVGRIRELADCTEELVGMFDVCLGQAVSRAILIVAELVEFFQRVIADGQFPFSNLLRAVNNFVGDSQHDLFEFTVSPPLHIDTGVHFANAGGQSSLTCLLSRLLGDGDCARATADLTNSAVQFVFVPLLVTENLLITDYSGLDFSGSDDNPFASGNRQAFEDFLLDILCVVTDRSLLLLDSFGHLLQCIDGVDILGDAIVDVAVALQDVIEDLKQFFVLAVEVVLQAIVWFMTTLGQGPFGNSSAEELETFFDLLFEFLLTVFDFILSLIRFVVDYFLFPFFPELFGQGSLLGNNPGTATFTECFAEFRDCICGITKIFADDICLPLDIGCLDNFWPECGDFNPGKRVFFNGTLYGEDGRIASDVPPWVYYADRFNNTFCKDVFERWREGPAPDTSVDYGEGMQYINCLSMVRTSIALGGNYTGPADSDIFIDPVKLNDTAVQFARATSAYGGGSIANTMLMYSEPAAILGRPESSAIYINFERMLEKHNIDNRLAVKMADTVRTSFENTLEKTRSLIDSDPDAVNSHLLAKNFVSKTGHLMNRGVALGVAFWQSAYNEDLLNKVWRGLGQAYNSTATRLRSVPVEQRKRNYDIVGGYDPDAAQRVFSGHWPYRISGRELKRQRRRIFFSGLEESAKHMLGYETVSPKYNFNGELDLEDHIPNSCTRVFAGCSNASQIMGAPVGCTDEFNFLNTRVCQNVFGHAMTVNCGENDQGQLFVSFLFWEKFSFCARPEPLPPDFTLSQFAGDPPLNETACLDTSMLSPDPDPGSAGIICITRDSCNECPVDQVFPGFDCRFVDEFVHREEAQTRRCIDKLGVGPPIPQIPDNFTMFTLDPFTSLTRVPEFNTRCGNGQVDLVPYNYTNPLDGVLLNFTAEECDPPYSFNATAGMLCNAACQFSRCGNGITDPGEECDQGDLENQNNNPGRADGLCTPLCTFNTCGDGILSFAARCTGDRFNPLDGTPCDPDGSGAECGVLDCELYEECDDGNRLANDGCDRFCKAEICPEIVTASERGEDVPYTDSFGPCISDASNPDLYDYRTEATRPDFCFLLPLRENDSPRPVTHSVEVNCKAYDPIIMIYPNDNCDGRTSIVEFEILRNCTEQPTRCAGFVGTPNVVDCLLPIGTGLDFTCSRNCAVCGNNITEEGEECDDGSIFVTGDPMLDMCVGCRETCTCAVDPSLPCRGFCLGGPRDGRGCDPRDAPADSCNGPDFDCVPFECCGDGIIQASENRSNDFSVFCDDNPNDDPFNPNNSTCVGCRRTQCECQPGRPCLGHCQNKFSINHIDTKPCDVREEPFACPEPDEVCIPHSCCGDGILQQFESGFNDGFQEPFCEPGVSFVSCDEDCRYLDGDGDQLCPELNGMINKCPQGGRRDECECTGADPCVGRCLNSDGTDFDELTFCDRDASLAGNESICEQYALGAVCGAVACCGDALVSGDYERNDLLDFDPCENAIPPADPAFCSDPECLYNNRWFFIAPCTCTSEPCMGRCSFRGDATPMLCDPLDATFGQTWCPWASDEEYACWPQGCCNDGTEQLEHGYDSPLGSPMPPNPLTFRIDPLETSGCDDQSCADDCGIAENIETLNGLTQAPVFTSCECQPGFECAGYCVDDTTGYTDDVTLLCNATPGAINICDPGETCIAQACCGDGIQHYIEGCEPLTTTTGCPTDCNISFTINRKRSIPFAEEKSNYSEHISPRQYYADPASTYILAQKSDFLTEFIFTIVDWVLDAFNISSAGNIQQTIIDFLGLRGTDIYLDPEERGIEWYLVFPLPGFCRLPANTCCDEGFGALTTLGILLPYTFIVTVVIGVAFGSSISSCMVMIMGMLWFSIFSGMAWFYSFPGCVIPTLRVPECIGRDVSEILNATNTTCLPWPEGVVVSPAGPTEESCNATCTRDILDCRAHGFHDGTDILVYYLQRYWPDAFDVFESTFIFSFLDGIEYFMLTFARFDYGGMTPPGDDHWCYSVTFLNIFQIVAILVTAGLILFVLVQIAIRVISRIVNLFERIEYMIFRFRIANDQQPRLSWPR